MLRCQAMARRAPTSAARGVSHLFELSWSKEALCRLCSAPTAEPPPSWLVADVVHSDPAEGKAFGFSVDVPADAAATAGVSK